MTNLPDAISIDGNATLQMWMTDSSDTLGIKMLNKNGGMWFSNNWTGTQTLGGGNLSIH